MSVAMAVLCSGEVVAGTGEGGAATVEAVGVVDVSTTGLIRPKKEGKKSVHRSCRVFGRRRGVHTVSLSQLIQRGVMILVKVMAHAGELSVSLRIEGKEQWVIAIPIRKATSAPMYTLRRVMLNRVVQIMWKRLP